MRRRSAGFNLLELMVGLVVAATAPRGRDSRRSSKPSRGRACAWRPARWPACSTRRVPTRWGTAPTSRSSSAPTADGGVEWSLYRDGDGDGVLSQDIESGVDPRVGPARQLAHLGRQVRFGFPPGPPPRDPGDPRRRLDRLDDPIRFNRSDLASFDPLGGATPGSIYLTDGRHQLAAVRVLGVTGRVRVLVYDAGARELGVSGRVWR